VTVNYAPNQSQCYVRLPLTDLTGSQWLFADQMEEVIYERDGNDLQSRGLYLRHASLGDLGFRAHQEILRFTRPNRAGKTRVDFIGTLSRGRWLRQHLASARLLQPGGHQIMSQGLISSLGWPQRCVQPHPDVTINVCPRGCVSLSSRSPLDQPRYCSSLILLHSVHRLAIKLFHDRDTRHRIVRRIRNSEQPLIQFPH
jgi:hypothetical protein